MANGLSMDWLAQRMASVTSVRPEAQGADGQITQSSHDSRTRPGSDLQFVFLVQGVGAAGQYRQQMPLITVSVFGAPHGGA